MATLGNGWASQVLGDYPSYYCYLAEDINLTEMDSAKVVAVEIRGIYWNGHTWHQLDSLYLCFTSDSPD